MNRIRTVLCALLLTGPTAFAGTFTADFATQDTTGFYLNGAGTNADGSAWSPIIATNRLVLTAHLNYLNGSISPFDLDNGAAIEAFTATFKLQFGPGTANAADGLSFSFGPGVSQNTTYSEVGAGFGSFVVCFHTYTSNGGPGVDMYLNGNQIGHVSLAKTDMVNSQLQDVVIQLKQNSTVSVTYRGQAVYTDLYLPDWQPTSGFFNISGRTGGENEETDIANLSINTTLYNSPVAPTITTAPKDVSVPEGGSASFSVSFDGTGPFTLQWTKNGVDITDATNQTLTLSPALYADNNAQFAVKITNPATTVTSSPATLVVIRDNVLPTVTKAAADASLAAVFVTYSKPVSDTALVPSNYSLDQGVTISGVTRLNAQSVKLSTSQLAPGVTLTLTINGVQDIATLPNTIAANTKVQFRSFVYFAGGVLHKKYTNITDTVGWPLSNLFNDSRYPDAPDRVDMVAAVEYPSGGVGRIAADDDPPGTHLHNYFDSVEGYFIPPVTTNYVFYTAGADRFALWLSTDDNPANKSEITELSGWTNPRSWTQGQPFTNGVPSGIPGAQSDLFGNTQWPYGNTISLTAGQRYYMLLVHHDPSWAGGDEFAATYTLESEPAPAPGDAPKLTGDVVGYFFDPTGASITFNQQPQKATALQGTAATFTVAATGTSVYGTNVLFQWQAAPKGSTTFTNIPSATSASYTTPLLAPKDDGMQYQVIATVAPITLASSAAAVTVTADTTLPVITAGAMADSVAGTVDIGVGFSKTIDASVGQLANYSVAGGTLASLTVYTNRFTANSQNPLAKIVRQSVLLKVTGLAGNSGVLTVKNITDTFGNTVASTNLAFTVASGLQWGVVGANELKGTNAVIPVAANGFDLYSDGVGEWATYDEATFVYEQVSGDFDKKLRVEYQDGSSQWARAGLIARDVTNFGVDRNAQTTNSLAGRYQKCFVSPVGATLTGPGNAGAQDWELNRRLLTGGATDGPALTGANSIPQYPNAWCRLQRVGQKFTMFRSDDGVTWVTLASTTFGLDGGSLAMPTLMYVGPEFSPEDTNINAPDQGTFLAQIRDYGNYVAVIDPQLKIATDATGKVTISWISGTLVSSPTVQGTYGPVQGATSPFVVTPSGSATTFYRVKQ
jgi:hypothetical protein